VQPQIFSKCSKGELVASLEKITEDEEDEEEERDMT
jgi:hypothetical protein